jgi:hypothetical protein
MMVRLAPTIAEDGRNLSIYWLDSVTWRIASGTLNVAFMKIDKCEHDALYVQY